MPKVYTHKAGKDYPAQGIKKGDTYYEWVFYRQRPIKSRTYPTRAQLTQNDVLQTVYSAYDDNLDIGHSSDLDDIISSLEDAASSAREKYDNLPEGFQQGEQGQLLETQADNIDTAVSEIEDLKSEMEAAEEEAAIDDDGNLPDDFEYDFDVNERFQSTEPELS